MSTAGVFRVELVMRINVTAHDLLEREALIDAPLAAHIALLTCEDRAVVWPVALIVALAGR